MKTEYQTNHAIRHSLFPSLLTVGILAFGGAQAATLSVDLKSHDSGSIITSQGEVLFQFDTTQPAGTGVLDPFLRIQSNDNEEGYNTSYLSPPVLDDKTPVNYTHDLPFGNLVADIDGYYSFVLDINEPDHDKSLLSLDGLKLFSGAGGQSITDVNALGTVLWDMDLGDDRYVLLDYSRNPGSGVSDMLLRVPDSVFAGLNPTDNIILWSQFGLQNGAESGDGFEEWAYILSGQEDFCTLHPDDPSCGDLPPPPIPEPGILALIGLGTLSMVASCRLRVST